MWLRTLLRTWLGRRQGPIQTRKKIGARKPVKPMLEILEDRLAPAAVSLVNGALDFIADPSVSNVTITVTAPSSTSLQIVTNGDTMSLGSGAIYNSNFSLSNGVTSTLTISNVNNTGGPSISTFNLYLGNNGDTLNFGLANIPGIGNVNIGGSAPTVVGEVAFSGDTITDTQGWAGFQSGDTIAVSGSLSDSSVFTIESVSGNVLTLTAAVAANETDPGVTVADVTEPPPTDTLDTVNLNPLAISDSLNVSAETINFEGGSVDASTMSLASVNSLTFASTGVPYLGAATINAAPPTGQPFAGDPYITGPDWGAYGYEPGDTIALDGGPMIGTVANVVGDNLYLNLSPGVTITTGNFPDVTVACTNFTPEIQATNLTLDVTGSASSISGAVSPWVGSDFVLLNAATADGNITIDLPSGSGDLVLGTLNAGTGTIQLDVHANVNELANSPVVSGAYADYLYSQARISPKPNPFTSYANVVNLTADAVDLTTTGTSSPIGVSGYPITTSTPTQSGEPAQSLELSAATNDGSVYIQDGSPAGLTINSVVADQGGQAATVNNGQIVYNSTPSSTTPTYVSGDEDVSISSTGPIVLNSVSATGDVTITSAAYLLEGNAQSPNIIAQEVDLVATGTADYQGQVTFANNAGGDTMTLPDTADTWSQLGFAAGDPIFVSGASASASASANDGAFTIASVSGYTLTLTESYVLAPETQPGVTVGDGVIGQASAAISLSDVPLFSATTVNGDIYLEPGAAVDSTAVYVDAGGMYGMANNASVTSQADFLTVEDITATGTAAVAMNSGSLIEYPSNNGSPGLITGSKVSLTSPYNIGTASSPFETDATSGLTVAATATSPSSAAIHVDNISSSLTSVGVSTDDGSVTILSDYNGSGYAGSLSFDNSVLSETGDAAVTFANTDDNGGSDDNVVLSGIIYVSGISAGISADGTAGAGQILSAANSNAIIIGGGGTVILSAGSGIGSPGTALDSAYVATLDATTNTGGIYIENVYYNPLTLSASTSNGDIDVSSYGEIDLSSSSVSTAGPLALDSISATGTVTLDSSGGAIVDVDGSPVVAGTLVLTATGAIGTAGSPLETSSPGTLTLTAAAGDGLFLDNNTALTVNSAAAGTGDLSISATGNLTLLGNVGGGTENVTLTATDGTLTTTGNISISANSLTITAEQIGSTSDVIQTSATTINATANYGGIYLSNNNSGTLALTAAAVGPTPGGVPTNNIEIDSAGNIVLHPQTTTLTELATTLPVAVLNPGGALTLLAGETLSADGTTPTTENSSATITSADAGDTPSTYWDVWTGTYDINGATPFSDDFSTSNNSGGLDSNWTVQSGSFTVDTTSQTATATDTAGINLVTESSISSVDESVSATISGTLASGQNAGLVALFSSLSTYYYGSIAATSSTTYTASIYSVVGGSATPLAEQSYNGSVSNAVLEFTVAGSSLTLLLNGSMAASATSSSITTAGIVGILASSGVSFSNFNSSPSLQIESNTAEVLVSLPGSASSTDTLLELTASELEAGGTFIGGTIEIEGLGENGQPGTVTVTGDLVLDATAGPITFEDTLDTIEATGSGTITLVADDVADLGNLTTAGGDISISAGGNIGVGTVNAATGIVSITSSSGAIFNSKNESTTLTVTAGLLALHESAQSTSSAQSASSAASAAQSASLQDQLNAAQAAATADAAAAVAAADQTTAAAFKAALTSIQAAVTIDDQTYQADVQITNAANQRVNAQQNVVADETLAADVLDAIGATAELLSDILAAAVAGADSATAVDIDIPGLNTISTTATAIFTAASADAAFAEASADIAGAAVSLALIASSNVLAADESTVATDQAAQDQAYAQLQADTDTETAFAAAYSVAEQGYTSALATSNRDEMTSASAQQTAAVAEANATTASEAASVAAASSPQPVNVTGPVAISDQPGASGVNWTNPITSTSTVNETSQGPLTMSADITASAPIVLQAQTEPPTSTTSGDDLSVNSDVTIQSTGSSIMLSAGDNVDIDSGSTIEASSTIAITANANDDPNGASATVDGTLMANSASIGVDSGATGNETFTITPSATTPISVDGGSDSSGANTLNFNAEGLAVTISDGTITAGTLAPVTFTNIEIVNVTNEAGGGSITVYGQSGVGSLSTGNETFTITPSSMPISVDGGSDSSGANTLNFNAKGLAVTISGDTITAGTLAPVTFANIEAVNITNEAGSSLALEGTNGAANTMSLVGAGQEAGTATLNGIAFSFSAMTSFSYQGGAGDTIAVTPFASPSLAWDLAVTVAGGAGAPASLTYNAAGPDDTVTATGKDAGAVVEPGVATVLFSNVSQVTVAYQGIQNVEILPNLTVSDANGIYNGKAFSATVQVNGAASLDGITPTVAYYRGTILNPLDELSAAPTNAGAYTVDAAFAGNATYTSASALTTFTIAPGTPQVSVNPVTLTYGAALANSQLSGTATFIVNGAKVNVPGSYSYTSAAGTVLAASASAYTEQVTFTPNNTIDYVTQTDLSVMVAVPVPVLAAATAAGPTTEVRVTYSNGTSYTFKPFGSSFKAGATVALGDVTGDGYPDIIVASGDSGTAGTVHVYNGVTRALIASYTPLGSFGGGLDVAVGDVAGSGRDDIVVGVLHGGYPLVTVLNGATGKAIDQFLAYSTSFKGGVRVGVGEISGAGDADVVVGPGVGQHGLPVEVYSGQSILTGTPQLLASFTPFASSYTGAVSVAVGDLTSTSYADIVVGTQSSGEQLAVYSGAALSPTSPPTPLFTQNSWATTDNSGVKVALVPDAAGNGFDDLIVSNGTGSKTARYLNSDLTAEGWPTSDAEFFIAIPGVTTGVYVG